MFAAHPEVAVFVYGHTHRASVVEIDDRVVVNTGTWLKRLHRQSVLFGLVPWVFYPSFRLNYVRITAEKGAVAVDYRVIEKPNPNDLTLLERSLTRKPQLDDPIPARVVVDRDPRSDRPAGEHSLRQSPSDGPDE